MIRGKNKVEQVDMNGEIVSDFDYRLTSSELYTVLKKNFPNIRKNATHQNYIECSMDMENFLIRVKNITYLGKLHKKKTKRDIKFRKI